MASFQRIDDLIERMGAITRQLKSYARKGGEAFEVVDLRAAISSALAMMEPQLKARTVRITRTLPRTPVLVMADRIRLEQVIINLLRNALDATKTVGQPQVEILLTAGDSAVLSLRDNGPGISDLDKLFEPFWTTKKPGEGTGAWPRDLLLIVADFGGVSRRIMPRQALGLARDRMARGGSVARSSRCNCRFMRCRHRRPPRVGRKQGRRKAFGQRSNRWHE